MFLQMIPMNLLKIVDSYNKLCESIHKKCNEFRKKKKNIYIGLKLDVPLALKKDSRKAWKWVKKE